MPARPRFYVAVGFSPASSERKRTQHLRTTAGPPYKFDLIYFAAVFQIKFKAPQLQPLAQSKQNSKT